MKEPLASVIDAFRRWMLARGYAEASISNYPRILKSFFRILGEKEILSDGHLNVAAITPQVVAEYQAYLYDYVSPKTFAKLSLNSQLGMLGVLITFCRFLVATHRLAKNPSRDIQLPRQNKSLPKNLLTPEEARRLLSTPDTNTVVGFRDRVTFEIFWATGMRISELFSLVVADVNFTEGLITIRQGKGAKDRVVPVGQGALGWIAEYIERVRPLFLRSIQRRVSQPRSLEYLFLGEKGGQMDKMGFHLKLKIYLRRARIKKRITSHTFRHTLATEMLTRGADLRHIQELLGHERLATTQRYTHIVKGELKKVHGESHPRERVPFAQISYRGATHEAD